MNTRPVSTTIIILCLGLIVAVQPAAAQGSDSFTVGPLTAGRGERVSGIVEVPAGVDEIPWVIRRYVHCAFFT